MKQKIILTIALVMLLNLSMIIAASDFVSILNEQDDWFETPWPYGADAVAKLDQVDERFNSDSIVTCNEICLYNNYKSCAYSVMAYHHTDGEVTYFKFGTNLGEQLNLEHATTGADNFDKVSMFYKCTSDDSLIEDFSNIKFIGIDSLLSDDDSFQTTAEFDIDRDNRVDGKESCESLGYGNCAFMYQYVENTEIDKDFFAKEVNFEIEDCSSSMDIGELDNPHSDYRNVKGMNVACLKKNVGGFQGLIDRIFSWFNDLFGKTGNQDKCSNEGNLCCYNGKCSDEPVCEVGEKLIFEGCDNDCDPQYTCEEKNKEILLFIDSSLLPNLQLDIDTWKQDVNNEYNYEINQKSIFEESPEQIKEIILNEYNSEELKGVMFVGNIPTIISRLCLDGFGKCPTDHFYHDLEGDCFARKVTEETCGDDGCHMESYYDSIDENKCRDFKEKPPRFWVSRLTTPDSEGNNLTKLSSYFKRNHQYRTGQKNYEHKMLAYLPVIDSDFSEEAEEIRQRFLNQNQEVPETNTYYSGEVNIIVDQEEYGEVSEKYSGELNRSYEQVFYNGHGSELSQQGMTSNHLGNITPNPLFYSLMSCSVGDFTTDNYLAGYYLFNGDGLMVISGTVPIMVVNQFPSTQSFMLDNGFSFDYLYKSNFAIHLLGDPTLKLSKSADTKIEIGDVNLGKLQIPENNALTREFNITYKNLGNEKINILFSKKSNDEIGQYIEGIFPSLLFSLEPKEVKTVSSKIDVLDSLEPQEFNVTYSFYTNSKDLIKSFEISGEIVR